MVENLLLSITLPSDDAEANNKKFFKLKKVFSK